MNVERLSRTDRVFVISGATAIQHLLLIAVALWTSTWTRDTRVQRADLMQIAGMVVLVLNAAAYVGAALYAFARPSDALGRVAASGAATLMVLGLLATWAIARTNQSLSFWVAASSYGFLVPAPLVLVCWAAWILQRRRFVNRTAIAALYVLLVSNVGEAATVGLFSTPNCASCNLNIPASASEGTFYICASGANVAEFCGGSYEFEFRITGLRVGWVATVVPAAAAQYALGDPFDRGCNIAFSTPQTEECTLLYTVTIAPSAPGARATLRIAPHLSPSNPDFTCIRAAPACNRNGGACVGGGALLINSDATCSVAVEPTSWTQVKSLYE